jgi:SAM-dependent methyltransferase
MPEAIAVAEKVAPEEQWLPIGAEQLPFPAGSFDLVLCQHSLHHFKGAKTAALAEARRVLVDHGSAWFTVWCPIDANPGYARLRDALVDLDSALAAGIGGGFGESSAAGFSSDLQEAGFSEVWCEVIGVSAVFSSSDAFPRQWLESSVGICRRREAGNLTGTELEAFVDRASILLTAFVREDGEVELPMKAHLISGTAGAVP